MPNILTDRYLGESLALPFSWNDVQIKQNEFATSDNINAAFEKLDYNLQYIEAQTQLATNIIPQGYVGWVGNNPLFLNGANVNTNTALTNDLLDAVDGAFVVHATLSSTYFGFVATPSSIIVYEATPLVVNQRSNTSIIKGTSTFTFDTITSIVINEENSLYVCDGGASIIYKFDISNITSGVSTGQPPTSLLTNVVGGSGTLYDHTRFNSPTKIALDSDSNLYVIDTGNKGIKIYDKELNWLNSLYKINDFTNNPFVDLFVDSDTDHLFVLTTTGIVYEYNKSTGEVIKQYTLDDELISGEEYSGIIQSQNDTNIIYIITTQNVIKKFKSKLEKTIGRFRLADNNIGTALVPEEFTYVSSIVNSLDTSVDNIFLGGSNKVLRFQESVTYQSVAYTANKFALSAVNVQPSEFIDPFTVNKALDKLLFNHRAVLVNLHSRFVGTYNANGLLEFTGTRYLLDSDGAIYGFDTTLDHFVGINELLSTAIVNRCLNNIYKLQSSLLDVCADVQTNNFPLPTQPLLIQ